MLFIDSSVRLKYDRQLEHTWNQSVIQVFTTVPGWRVRARAHVCVHARASACMCVCGSGFVLNISSVTKH